MYDTLRSGFGPCLFLLQLYHLVSIACGVSTYVSGQPECEISPSVRRMNAARLDPQTALSQG